ncbi:MAG: Gfo/Idh/MocA family oxidoreductase [Opitutaceae bacterium]|nr:Gfo/Idh/MocA family oxidoreductase [Opitutaceae bacterium]
MSTPSDRVASITAGRVPGPASSRRDFLHLAGAALGAALPLSAGAQGADLTKIQGFEQAARDPDLSVGWKPVSERRIRVGIAGYGVCKFGAVFGFQDHPNVEVVAVTDLFPDRCAALARECRCAKTYPSLEEMIKDPRIEAVFVATDAPSHARHCIAALKHGKHVAVAVPAVFGSLEEADLLWETVRTTGLTYMMFETSAFHADLHAMREIYRAGGLGKVVYAEGEYYHYMSEPIDSYQGWRIGLPPQWYPTHSNAYYPCVTGGSFTRVSCIGTPSLIDEFKPGNNGYRNPFGTEIAMFQTSEGGSARMAVSWDTPGASGEMGRIRGQRGTFYGEYKGLEKKLPPLKRPPLPPGVAGAYSGHHGGSHGPLMNEFVMALLENRTPLVNIAMALNLTVSGIVAHQSALRDGEWMKIPQYRL